MRWIDINDFYMGININKRKQYCHANQNTKDWERWTSFHIFPIETTNSLTCFLINHCHQNKFQQTLLFYFLFSESFTWIFNYSLWVWYLSLGTNYYFQQRCTCRKKSSANPTHILQAKCGAYQFALPSLMHKFKYLLSPWGIAWSIKTDSTLFTINAISTGFQDLTLYTLQVIFGEHLECFLTHMPQSSPLRIFGICSNIWFSRKKILPCIM